MRTELATWGTIVLPRFKAILMRDPTKMGDSQLGLWLAAFKMWALYVWGRPGEAQADQAREREEFIRWIRELPEIMPAAIPQNHRD